LDDIVDGTFEDVATTDEISDALDAAAEAAAAGDMETLSAISYEIQDDLLAEAAALGETSDEGVAATGPFEILDPATGIEASTDESAASSSGESNWWELDPADESNTGDTGPVAGSTNRWNIDDMSPEELDAYTERLSNRNAAMDAQMRSSEFVENVERDVAESNRRITESWAESFDPTRYEPFDTGITLEDSDVPHSESEFVHHDYGIIEKDGRYYKEYADGVYHRSDADGNWL
jgi:hypothetical protein